MALAELLFNDTNCIHAASLQSVSVAVLAGSFKTGMRTRDDTNTTDSIWIRAST